MYPEDWNIYFKDFFMF